MHTLPVDHATFSVALALTSSGGFLVTADEIRMNKDVFWTAKHGVDQDSARSYPNLMRCVEHFLKSRRSFDMNGWDELSDERQDEILIAQCKKLNTSLTLMRPWPINAQTGAEYVEACAWYDRVEAELADKAAEALFAGPRAVLEDALRLAEKEGDAQSACEALFYGKPMGLPPPTSEPTAWRSGEMLMMDKDGKVTPLRITAKQADEMAGEKVEIILPVTRPEQPWERQARVAASAGYAHVAPEEDWIAEASHLSRMGVIRDGNKNLFTKSYACPQPPDALSGMRSVNGWAVSGFAVTDAGFAQTYGSVRDCRAATQGDATALLRKHARGGR